MPTWRTWQTGPTTTENVSCCGKMTVVRVCQFFSRAATTPKVANSPSPEEAAGRRIGSFVSSATSRQTHCTIAVTLGRPHCSVTMQRCNEVGYDAGTGCVPTNTRTFRLRGGRLDCRNCSRNKGVAVCQLRHVLTSASARGSWRVARRSPARNESWQYRGGLRMNDNDLSSAAAKALLDPIRTELSWHVCRRYVPSHCCRAVVAVHTGNGMAWLDVPCRCRQSLT